MKSKFEETLKHLEFIITDTQHTIDLIRNIPIGIPIILHTNVYLPEAQAIDMEKKGYIITNSRWSRYKCGLTKNPCIVENYNKISLKIKLIAAELSIYPFTKRGTKNLLMNIKYRDIVTWSTLDIKTNLLLMVNYEIKTYLFDELLKVEGTK